MSKSIFDSSEQSLPHLNLNIFYCVNKDESKLFSVVIDILHKCCRSRADRGIHRWLNGSQ